MPLHLQFSRSTSRFGIQCYTSVTSATSFLSIGLKPRLYWKSSVPASAANSLAVTGENSPKVVIPVGIKRVTTRRLSQSWQDSSHLINIFSIVSSFIYIQCRIQLRAATVSPCSRLTPSWLRLNFCRSLGSLLPMVILTRGQWRQLRCTWSSPFEQRLHQSLKHAILMFCKNLGSSLLLFYSQISQILVNPTGLSSLIGRKVLPGCREELAWGTRVLLRLSEPQSLQSASNYALRALIQSRMALVSSLTLTGLGN